MYSFHNFETIHCSLSDSAVSWPSYMFLRKQVRWPGIPISLRIFHSLLWSHKYFSIVNKTEGFLEFLCFFYDTTDIDNWLSGFSVFSKSSWYIWKFSVHVLLRPSLENIEHYFASRWEECNCAVVWRFFGIAFLWDWNENWPFPVLCSVLSFPSLLAYRVQHFNSSIF